MSADVSIRPFRSEDVPGLFESVRESIDDLSPWMPWCHSEYAISEARDWVGRQIAAFEARDEFHFAIVTGDQQIAGVCGLNGINRENRLANLGYWVRSSHSQARNSDTGDTASGRLGISKYGSQSSGDPGRDPQPFEPEGRC